MINHIHFELVINAYHADLISTCGIKHLVSKSSHYLILFHSNLILSNLDTVDSYILTLLIVVTICFVLDKYKKTWLYHIEERGKEVSQI